MSLFSAALTHARPTGTFLRMRTQLAAVAALDLVALHHRVEEPAEAEPLRRRPAELGIERLAVERARRDRERTVDSTSTVTVSPVAYPWPRAGSRARAGRPRAPRTGGRGARRPRRDELRDAEYGRSHGMVSVMCRSSPCAAESSDAVPRPRPRISDARLRRRDQPAPTTTSSSYSTAAWPARDAVRGPVELERKPRARRLDARRRRWRAVAELRLGPLHRARRAGRPAPDRGARERRPRADHDGVRARVVRSA